MQKEITESLTIHMLSRAELRQELRKISLRRKMPWRRFYKEFNQGTLTPESDPDRVDNSMSDAGLCYLAVHALQRSPRSKPL